MLLAEMILSEIGEDGVPRKVLDHTQRYLCLQLESDSVARVMASASSDIS